MNVNASSSKCGEIIEQINSGWCDHVVFATDGSVLKRERDGLRTVWVSRIIKLKRVKAPAWWAVPRETGTYDSKVDIPRVTCK